jgi:hypothetical protein
MKSVWEVGLDLLDLEQLLPLVGQELVELPVELPDLAHRSAWSGPRGIRLPRPLTSPTASRRAEAMVSVPPIFSAAPAR